MGDNIFWSAPLPGRIGKRSLHRGRGESARNIRKKGGLRRSGPWRLGEAVEEDAG